MCFPMTLKRRVFTTAVMIACAAPMVRGTGTGAGDFTRTWNGRRVVVKSTLYTVLYDEVGRAGRHYHGKVAGLTVATQNGQHYEFDGPGSDEDVVEPTPDRVMSEMSARFIRAYHLDIGMVKTITPLLLRQYDPGVTLIVDSVKVERTRIRLDFRGADHAEGDGFATSLVVEWPTPLSRTFHEREIVEGVLRRFVDPI
jgi:hypothetical protein